MQTIVPHLWFDREAKEAAKFYCSLFPASRVAHVATLRDTPSGDCDVVNFTLAGQDFMALAAGPYFKFTPAVSFLVACETRSETDRLWKRLSEDGKALMPFGAYPFSGRYGWTEDRYGLSWQVMLADKHRPEAKITPTLMFTGDVRGKAEQAVRFYAKVFPKSRLGDVLRYAEGEEPDKAGTIKHAGFELAGRPFAAMDSARADFGFNEAVSFVVLCGTQKEIDAYWKKLSAAPESEQCGWLKDKYGLSWQVVPAAMAGMMREGSEEQLARVTRCLLKMKKFDLAALKRAFEGRTGPARPS